MLKLSVCLLTCNSARLLMEVLPPLLKALGIALPPRVQATGPPTAAPATTPSKRRGRPRRSAKRT